MKKMVFLSLLSLVSHIGLRAQDQSFEASPTLAASHILQPNIFKGPHHQVAEVVETDGFLNRYVIESDFGQMTALGNEQLLVRIEEIAAIHKLREYSQSSEFAETLESAATDTVGQAFDLVLNTGESLANISSGASRTVMNFSETIRRGLKKSGPEKEQASLLFGIDSAKRKIAQQLGVDPYSTNLILQEELIRIARPIALADLTFSAGTSFIPGSKALTAFKAVKRTSDLSEKIKTMSPIDIHRMNREALEKMGVKKPIRERFLDEAWLSPLHQSQIVDLVLGFQTKEGRELLIAMAAGSRIEADARFFVRTISLLAHYEEQGEAFARLIQINKFPAGITESGALVIPLDLDLGAWTQNASQLAATVARHQEEGISVTSRVIYVTGKFTPKARVELTARGFTLIENAVPSVYRADWNP